MGEVVTFCPDKSRTHPHPSPTHHSSSCYSPATLLGSYKLVEIFGKKGVFKITRRRR